MPQKRQQTLLEIAPTDDSNRTNERRKEGWRDGAVTDGGGFRLGMCSLSRPATLPPLSLCLLLFAERRLHTKYRMASEPKFALRAVDDSVTAGGRRRRI